METKTSLDCNIDREWAELQQQEQLEVARSRYAKAANRAQLFGFLPGTKKKLANAALEYQQVWHEIVGDDPTDIPERGDQESFKERTQAELDLRKQAQAEDWDSRRYVRHLSRYHQLSRWQKLGVGAVFGAVSGGIGAVAGGVAAGAVMVTATARLGRGFIQRESSRLSSAMSDKEAAVLNRRPTSKLLGGIALEGIIDADTEVHIQEARRSIVWSLGGVAVGSALSLLIDELAHSKWFGGVKHAAAAPLIDAPSSEKRITWDGDMKGESAAVELFCQINNVDMDSLTEAQKAQIESGKGASVLQQLGEDQAGTRPKVPEWSRPEGASKDLRVKINEAGDYRFAANTQHNSIWDLSSNALELQGISEPSDAQIAQLTNDIVEQREKRGLGSWLKKGERVRISARMIKSVIKA